MWAVGSGTQLSWKMGERERTTWTSTRITKNAAVGLSLPNSAEYRGRETDRERDPWHEGGQVRRSQLSQTAKAQMSYTYVYMRDNTYGVVMDLNCFVRTRIGIQVVWAVMWVTASHLKAVTQPNAAATWVSAECGEP